MQGFDSCNSGVTIDTYIVKYIYGRHRPKKMSPTDFSPSIFLYQSVDIFLLSSFYCFVVVDV